MELSVNTSRVDGPLPAVYCRNVQLIVGEALCWKDLFKKGAYLFCTYNRIGTCKELRFVIIFHLLFLNFLSKALLVRCSLLRFDPFMLFQHHCSPLTCDAGRFACSLFFGPDAHGVG